MAHHFRQSVGLLTLMAVAILVGPLPSADAKETSVFKAQFVPALADDGATPAITFEKGKLRLKPKEARVRLGMDHVSAPPGTLGELVLSLMVNGGDPGEVTFPFEVMPEVLPVTDDREEAGAVNVVKVRAALTDALDLTPGDVVELLGAWVTIADEQVGALGFIVEALDEQPQTDLAEVVATLRSAGHTVELGGEIIQPFFSVEGQIILVNGDQVQVFEYEDATAAQADAVLVSPDGFEVGTTIIDWVATPHFYKTGNIIVLYVGDDASVVEALTAVVGPQFAGGGEVISGTALVERLDILILESFPVQVHVVATGHLPDGCTRIDHVTTQAIGSTFLVAITTARPADAVCTQAIVPFEEVIPLDVFGLKAGVYTVVVNGISAPFELSVDNVPQAESH